MHLVRALGELLDHLRAEGRQVVGIAARHETLIGHDLLVHHVGARVAQVGANARVEDPAGNEGSGLGPWSFKFERGDDGDRFKLDEVMGSDALLLGRKTYEGFAAAWPGRTDEAGFADKFNSMPKYVISATLEDSIQLVQTLMEHDLIDEYRLMTFPVVLGKGRRLFGEGSPTTTLQLADSQAVGPVGVLVLTYQRATDS